MINGISTTTTTPDWRADYPDLTSDQVTAVEEQRRWLSAHDTTAEDVTLMMPLIVRDAVDGDRVRQAHAHIPAPTWAAGLRTEAWQEFTDGVGACRYWTLRTWPELVDANEAMASTSVAVVGRQDGNGSATVGVQVYGSWDPTLTADDALVLARALTQAAEQVRGLEGRE